ncbi:hypothetical protein [uncultured Anaerococcus sp.]|uniref:hypothetical protein n=1 Tax=uncultured Anaerococcus sp. TaxID=293428 RepID=UPI002607B409|nr:hypothetical protein [uncultured Anaerococcus sp.]
MINVKFTVPITFKATLPVNIESNDQDVIDAALREIPTADMVDFDANLIDIDWDSAVEVENWEVYE